VTNQKISSHAKFAKDQRIKTESYTHHFETLSGDYCPNTPTSSPLSLKKKNSVRMMTLKFWILTYFVLSMPSVMILWNDGGEMSVQQHEAIPSPDLDLLTTTHIITLYFTKERSFIYKIKQKKKRSIGFRSGYCQNNKRKSIQILFNQTT